MLIHADCRVELRKPRRIHLLAAAVAVRPHFRSLDPYLSRLLHQGQTGMVVLVNNETGAVVARRQVRTAA